MPELSRTLQLLQASVDEDDESYLRFLFEDKFVKYVTIAAGIYAADDMCFGPTITSLLPTFPSGNWNYGNVTRNPQTSQPYFAQVIEKRLQGVKNAWHPTSVDHLELNFGKQLRSGVYVVTSTGFQTPIVAKFARFEWEIDALDDECVAYQWIEGQRIGPKFLGYITEEGRVIGFLIEKVADARHATTSDATICSKALADLHRLGVIHGDVNKHNFLINAAGATIIDFECARKSEDKKSFEVEMQSFLEQLNDMSGKGGSYTCTDQPGEMSQLTSTW